MAGEQWKQIKLKLNDPGDTYIFRIVKKENLAHILANKKICPPNCPDISGYAQLAKPDMLEKRARRAVPNVNGGGTLHDYVAFYFAPRSPMLYSLYKQNKYGVQCKQNEIVYLISQIKAIVQAGLAFCFTDRNAILNHASFTNQWQNILTENFIDWELMESQYWGRTTEEGTERRERRQAEFLVKGCVPTNCLLGIGVFSDDEKEDVEKLPGLPDNVEVKVKKEYYF